MNEFPGPVCPNLHSGQGDQITLAHGEGGRAMRRLIRERILRHFPDERLAALSDAAVLQAHGTLAFSTDSFVVSPLFFPGGDIGRLAVFGTANDLAVSGAVPIAFGMSLILEEGLPISTLDHVLASMAQAAESVPAPIITGDTKVVPRGVADGMFVNTTGIGQVRLPALSGPAALAPGDALIVSGSIARHGMAVLAARESIEVQPMPTTDCGCLLPAVQALWTAGIPIKAMRDATRGGLAAVLHEWAEASGQTLTVEETLVPVTSEVRGLCELLGIDPLFVANEGTMLVAVPTEFADAAVQALRATKIAHAACQIGVVQPAGRAPVTVLRGLRRELPLDEPAGALLPRIC